MAQSKGDSSSWSIPDFSNICCSIRMKSCLLTVSIVMIFVGFFVASPLILLGQISQELNRYYSAKTLHMHKVTLKTALPSQWNSLGSMYAYHEESTTKHTVNTGNIGMSTNIYHVDGGFVPAAEVEKQTKCVTRFYNKDTLKYPLDDRDYWKTRCLLENPYTHILFINGETLSILSSISPSIYLATLIVICQLSLVYFVFALIHARSPEDILRIRNAHKEKQSYKVNIMNVTHDEHGKANPVMKWAENLCCYFILLVFALYLFVFFVTSLQMPTVQWGPESASQAIEYAMSSQIPSIIYSVIVLIIYYTHQRKKDPYWEYLFYRDKIVIKPSPANAHAVAPSLPTYDESHQHESSPPAYTANVHPYKYPNNPNNPNNPQEMSMYGPAMGAHMFAPSMAVSMQVPVVQQHMSSILSPAFGVQRDFGHKQQLIMDSTGWVSHEQVQHKTFGGDVHRGPVANETSIIICMIVLLGGIANLGMSQGYMLETEAQLVIISLFVFCVLELSRTHLKSYFFYLSSQGFNASHEHQFQEDISHNNMMRFILVFVDVVVFILQLLIIIIWQMTMNSITHQMDALRVVLLLVILVFLALRVFSVVQGLGEFFTLAYTTYSKTATESKHILHTKKNESYFFGYLHSAVLWQCEGVAYGFCVWLLILALLVIPVSQTSSSESTLRFLEKMNYGAMRNVKTWSALEAPRNTCKNGVQVNSLLFVSLAAKSANKMTWHCTNEKVYGDSGDVDPIDMKVFAWTRSFRLQDRLVSTDSRDVCMHNTCQGASVLFCSNGFEQHWGQCKNEFHHSPGQLLRPTWAYLISESLKAGKMSDGSLMYAGTGNWKMPASTSMGILTQGVGPHTHVINFEHSHL